MGSKHTLIDGKNPLFLLGQYKQLVSFSTAPGEGLFNNNWKMKSICEKRHDLVFSKA